MTRSDEIDTIAQTFIPRLSMGEVTAQSIRDMVFSPFADNVATFNGYAPLSDEEKEALCRDLAYRFLHVRALRATIFHENYEPWLAAERPNIRFSFWKDYENYLLGPAKFDADSVESIDKVTDDVVDLSGNPTVPGIGLRKGIVVGNVQSGKTADYIGVITKAADCGYRVIIVLAGIQNNLRSQTQGRIDEGFIGRSLVEGPGAGGTRTGIVEKVVGVGKSASNRPLSVLSLTTLQSDFSGTTAGRILTTHGSQDSHTVYVAVVKKNSAVLKALHTWFSGAKMRSFPMLLVDDEADNASINYRDADDPTMINRRIRDLLGLFTRAAYVGYTATPFANIFIDPDVVTADHGEDLFPRDFVVALEAPDRYMGPKRIFGAHVAPEDEILREIRDNEPLLPLRHRRTLELPALPDSLKVALCQYVLTTAIRMASGDKRCHSSALVNVSRFIHVHRMVATLVRGFIDEIKDAVAVYGLRPYSSNSVLTALHDVYAAEFATCGKTWEDLQPHLRPATQDIEVLEIHMEGDAKTLDYSRENYPDGRRVIAIGGFSLSRGLTLVGLCSSYVIRNSIMYDTLMQMGRWFGYRPGYGHLCRVYLLPEAIGWYRHITQAMEELWDEFREMKKANLTPSEFGLRVMAHPLNLIVTARNKMRSATEVTVQVDLAGRHIEPNSFKVGDLDGNFNTLDVFVSGLGAPNGDAAPCAGHYWTEIPNAKVKQFIRQSRRLDINMDTASGPLCEYLDKLEASGTKTCDVYLASVQDEDVEPIAVGGVSVRREAFSIEVTAAGNLTVGGGRHHVTGADQEGAGLDETMRTEAYQTARDAYLGDHSTLPARFYRRFRSRPLLVLHVVSGKLPKDAARPVNDCSKIVVWRLAFPGAKDDNRIGRLVSYVLNPVAVRQGWDADGLEDEEETAGEANA